MGHVGPRVLLAVLGMAAAQGGLEPPVAVSFPADGPLELSGRLYRPSGSGPFPAVVLLHGCDGMVASMAQMEKVAATLSGSGYVVLAVDSFGPRGVRTVCDDSMLIKSPDPRERVGDAIAAKRYLSTLASVQSSHVGLIGWAHGGTTALMAWARAAEPSGGAPFAAIAAYYPVCGVMGLDIRASNTPLLIFIGDRDDVVSASGCRSLIENAIQIRRRDLSIEVYPGATHLFDGPPGGEKSVTIGRHSFAFDEAAAQDSRERLLAFLKRTLGQ